MEDFVDAYAVLGVGADADASALKAAHRRLVQACHPDVVPVDQRAAATRRVQVINVAYGLVRDPGSRVAYDQVRRARLAGRAVAQARGEWDELARAAGRWAGRRWRR